MTDGTQRGSADFPNALRDSVSHCIQLIGLFVQKQVIVAKVGSTHVPAEVLGLKVKSNTSARMAFMPAEIS
jgi:hypothetical protein